MELLIKKNVHALQKKNKEVIKLKNTIKRNLVGFILIGLFSFQVQYVLGYNADKVNIERYEGILEPNEVLNFELKKDVGTDSWIIDISCNDTLEYFLVLESGKNYLMSNNATFVENEDLIKSGIDDNITLKVSSNNTKTIPIWLVIKNPLNSMISFNIVSFSRLYSRTTKRILIISILCISGIGIVAVLCIRRKKFGRRM